VDITDAAACARRSNRSGLPVDNWLRPIHELRQECKAELNAIAQPESRAARLCELNVIEQVKNVARTATVADAWERGDSLSIHGWIYDVADGLLRDLNVTVAGKS
jgi:carbonic anhydrase